MTKTDMDARLKLVGQHEALLGAYRELKSTMQGLERVGLESDALAGVILQVAVKTECVEKELTDMGVELS